MRIGITNTYIGRYGPEKGAERMKQHGYDTLDYGFPGEADAPIYFKPDAQNEKELSERAKLITAAGIEIIQTHGPWRYPPQDYTPEDRAERFEKMTHAIRLTSYLGCHNMVIHQIMPFGEREPKEKEAETFDINLEYMGRLCDYGKEYDVTVCIENMPMRYLGMARPKDLEAFVKALNHPYMKVCLDTGHASCLGIEPGDAARTFGKDLRVLHVHDNNGLNDNHWIPYAGVSDWEDFSQALVDIGYEGSMSLECNFPNEADPVLQEKKELELAALALRIARRI